MKPTSGSRNNVLCSWEQETHDASKETTAGSTGRVFLTCTMREYSKASELSVFMFFFNKCVCESMFLMLVFAIFCDCRFL